MFPDLVKVQQRRIELCRNGRRVEDQFTLGWEESLWKLADVADDPPFDAAGAQDYVEHLWLCYAHRYETWFNATPRLRVLHGHDRVNGARSSGLRHCIYVDDRLASRLVHETAHFFAPHVMHDPPWCRALIQMLAAEFHVPIGFSIELAREAGLSI
jgi:hypothetical protein